MNPRGLLMTQRPQINFEESHKARVLPSAVVPQSGSSDTVLLIYTKIIAIINNRK